MQVVPEAVWSSDLMELICSCVIKPSDVGFNMGDIEIMKNLPKEVCMSSLLNCMTTVLVLCNTGNKLSKTLLYYAPYKTIILGVY